MAQNDSLSRKLTLAQRTEVFDKTAAKVTKQYFDPRFNGTEWPQLAREVKEGIISREDPEHFELGKVSRSSARFDMAQLLRLNRQALHHAAFETVRDRLPPGATEIFWHAVRGNLDLLTEARHWWDVVAGEISPPALPDDAAYLSEALDLLPNEPWTAETWSAWTKDVKARTGKMGKGLFMPLRLALTGEPHGPELAALLPLIGRARAEHRLRLAGH